MKRLFNHHKPKAPKKKDHLPPTDNLGLPLNVIAGLARIGIAKKDWKKPEEKIEKEERIKEQLAIKKWQALVSDICGAYPPQEHK